MLFPVLQKNLLMKTQTSSLITALLLIFTACSKNSGDDVPNENPTAETGEIYFPPTTSDTWESTSIEELKWNADAEQPLYDLLDEKNTKAFLILKDGKIVIEKYFGSFTQDSIWYWASAGKTLTGFTVGIAQEQGLLNLGDKTSDYLGEGWTSATLEEENKITVRNQLSMTAGLKDNVLTFDCVSPNCLNYEADAGTRWAYHNGPYTLLQNVVSAAANTNFSAYFNTHLRNKIGMKGVWISTNGANNVHFSTARDMARFGILNLNNGVWDKEPILGDTDFISAMKNTSQDLNKSYGYLWWLNGKESYMVPSSQFVFDGELIPNAPDDTYAGLGKNDQKLYVVPSKGLVVVRMGEDTGEALLGPSSFDNELWERINSLITD